jgi:hypothetical protein
MDLIMRRVAKIKNVKLTGYPHKITPALLPVSHMMHTMNPTIWPSWYSSNPPYIFYYACLEIHV